MTEDDFASGRVKALLLEYPCFDFDDNDVDFPEDYNYTLRLNSLEVSLVFGDQERLEGNFFAYCINALVIACPPDWYDIKPLIPPIPIQDVSLTHLEAILDLLSTNAFQQDGLAFEHRRTQLSRFIKELVYD